MISQRIRKPDLKRDLMLAALVTAGGFAMSGLAAADLLGHSPMHFAQATMPLKSTPGADSKPSAPTTIGESQGVRPAEVAPQPARPAPDEVKAGTPTALPPAPAEKTAPAISTK